ncbi:MAG TPA: hypothetical protein VFC63_16395 [Blastocatellia bacterium]|nr:hypothetical protein [Blastocatellia bacterium]
MRDKTSEHTETTAEIAERIKLQIGSQAIPILYHHLVLSNRSRQYQLDAEKRGGASEIMHTLLGIELKIGRRRLICPDLATARYLTVFARIGVDLIAIPYDISRISRIADEFESSWHRTILLIEHLTANRTERMRNKVRKMVLDDIRNEIKKLGAGSRVPAFNQSTKQRKARRSL